MLRGVQPEWAKRSRLEKSEIEAAKKAAEERLAAAQAEPAPAPAAEAAADAGPKGGGAADVAEGAEGGKPWAAAGAAAEELLKSTGAAISRPVVKLLDMGNWWLCTTLNLNTTAARPVANEAV
jgi:hypothetical protein